MCQGRSDLVSVSVCIMCVCVLLNISCFTICPSLLLCVQSFSCIRLCDPMACSPPGASVHGFSSKNTRVGCHALLQEIFPTQGLSSGLPPCRGILLLSEPLGKPFTRHTQKCCRNTACHILLQNSKDLNCISKADAPLHHSGSCQEHLKYTVCAFTVEGISNVKPSEFNIFNLAQLVLFFVNR